MTAIDSYERTRESYRPERAGVTTTTLMVGESRPANGTFFYCAASKLFFRTRDAFVLAFGDSVADETDFLVQFQRNGFFLVDLCAEPVNHLKASLMPQRRNIRAVSEPRLARQLKRLRAGTRIVGVMKGIESNVRNAIAASGGRDLVLSLSLPFPAR